ncbi:MAG: shikimate dehydrogenase [candidate division Zixibacteria bacterium]|nr:shikimate dehydrogenase [candidate division Zixibacteria bacterium]MDH3935804.1 shikimate dehydrogenase [candidate division Zixibacteria bacterium]MDH4034779.1 shikimate dehydrogenase [candidate division Zixibacteria bacterium]
MTAPYRFGLVGHNVGYSKSSEIFEAIFKHLAADGSFEVFNIATEHFAEQFHKLIESGVQGLSVTIPYKSKVITFLDDLDPVARALQAVNSIHFNGGACCGFNTDCYGFSLPLHPHAERLKNGSALILGAGGGARAVVYALHTDYEIGCCTVMARDSTRLKSFKQELVKQLPNIRISTRQFANNKKSERDTWDIVVNCTPLGGWNHPTDSPLPEWLDWTAVRLYYDLNYNVDNSLTREAERAEIPYLDGSAMLVGQALQSFYIWTGLKVPFEPIYSKVFGD